MKAPDLHAVRHYAGYYALYVGHVVRYVMLDAWFDAGRCQAMAEASLKLATDCDLPEERSALPGDEIRCPDGS